MNTNEPDKQSHQDSPVRECPDELVWVIIEYKVNRSINGLKVITHTFNSMNELYINVFDNNYKSNKYTKYFLKSDIDGINQYIAELETLILINAIDY